MKNARISAPLAKAAASQRKAKPSLVKVTPIDKVIALWHAAECQHLLAGTTPADQSPTDADSEQVNRLMAVSRLGGC